MKNNSQILLISPNKDILTALKLMDEIKRKLLIVSTENKFIGLLSIGDIQRALINNYNLTDKISSIMRKDYIVSKPDDNVDKIKAKMLEIRAEFMPVVDEMNNISEIYFWEELFGPTYKKPIFDFDLPVVVMAGGLGTRLKPLTNVLPKPLIPINEKTLIEDIFERFNNHGCNTFHISVNYKAEFIEYYLRQQNLPYNLNFFKEDKPMGTAGSLSLLKEKINSTFFVTNCDILIDQDYSEVLKYHRDNNNEITVVATLKHYPIAYGTIETGENGLLEKLLEKPELTFKINSGMYILEPHLIKEIPNDNLFHITHLIEKVKNRNGRVGVFPISEKSWIDIGNWEEYFKNYNYGK
jgi:dTDP-glucose pyrophosphorylase